MTQPLYDQVAHILDGTTFAVLAFIELHGGEVPSCDLRDGIAAALDQTKTEVMALFAPAPDPK